MGDWASEDSGTVSVLSGDSSVRPLFSVCDAPVSACAAEACAMPAERNYDTDILQAGKCTGAAYVTPDAAPTGMSPSDPSGDRTSRGCRAIGRGGVGIGTASLAVSLGVVFIALRRRRPRRR